MERVTFSLLFYIRRIKLNRHGEAPILMRITVNGVRADVSIKKTILPQLWDVDKGRAVDKKREGKELNLYLDAINGSILKIQRDSEIVVYSMSFVNIMISVRSLLELVWLLQQHSVMRQLCNMYRTLFGTLTEKVFF